MGLTVDARQFIRKARSDDALRRYRREKKLRLPDGVDRDLYCAQGKHLRADYEENRSDGRKECAGCKADRDAARSVSKETCWWPRGALPAQFMPAGLLDEDGEDDSGLAEGHG
jgi:hypothetical protein